MKHRRRLLQEVLEPRLALSAEGLAWGNAPYLSISFAPDGTDVGGQSSRLFDYMSRVGPESAWQDTIVSAFQTWSVHTNGDIAAAPDDGSPFGTEGETQGDPRFGDIRVGAIPMRNNVLAIGVSRGFVSGTWSGDILFNSQVASVDTLDEVFRVALHEAGHVFGFEDSSDPTSPMFSSGIPQVAVPNAADLDELWSRFGQRSPDPNERPVGNDNNTEDDATHLFSSDSGYDGTTPLIHHADLGPSDVDVYRFDAMEGYQGAVTLEVRTDGLSQLHPTIRVINENTGDEIAADLEGNDGHVSVSISVDAVAGTDRHFVYVESGSTSVEGIGGYALVTTFDDDLLTTPATIDRFAGPEFRFLEADDIQDVFASDPEGGTIPFLRDDMHLNDDLAMATILEPVPGFNDGAKYELLGSLSDNTDIDYYQFESAAAGMTTPDVMSFFVENVESAELDLDVTIFDESGTVVAHQDLLHRSGDRLIQVDGIELGATHYVRVQAKPGATQLTGNYRLTMLSGTDAEQLNLWQSGTMSKATVQHTYTVLRPQLVMFAYEGAAGSLGSMTLTVQQEGAAPVLQIDGSADDFHSTRSVLLAPGRYVVETTFMGTNAHHPYNLRTAVISDPLAIIFRDLEFTPRVVVDSFNDQFVFPSGNGSGSGGDGDGSSRALCESSGVMFVGGCGATERQLIHRHDGESVPPSTHDWFWLKRDQSETLAGR